MSLKKEDCELSKELILAIHKNLHGILDYHKDLPPPPLPALVPISIPLVKFKQLNPLGKIDQEWT